MKKISSVVLVLCLFSCAEPMKITAKPDPTAATSGTLGSVKASDGISRARPDSSRVIDTVSGPRR